MHPLGVAARGWEGNSVLHLRNFASDVSLAIRIKSNLHTFFSRTTVAI